MLVSDCLLSRYRRLVLVSCNIGLIEIYGLYLLGALLIFIVRRVELV